MPATAQTALPNRVPIRDAASIVIVDIRSKSAPKVLMGRRHPRLAFMPGQLVFPGGGLDPEEDCGPDNEIGSGFSRALSGCAIRELREETGLLLKEGAGLWPFFRAVTPPGPPRRFDARFFLCPATAIAGDPEDFASADGELSELGWYPLLPAKQQNLPFITRLVLAEARAACLRAAQTGKAPGEVPDPRGIPFIDATGEVPKIRRISASAGCPGDNR